MHNLLYLHYILNAVMYTTFVVYNNKKLYKKIAKHFIRNIIFSDITNCKRLIINYDKDKFFYFDPGNVCFT